MREWLSVRLADVADIRFSNVDKKTTPGESAVRLCNYMNVYGNDYITADLPFMEASATHAEIARFGIGRGDVMITKDSETPDDIGISAVVTEEIQNLVCGYHLALIKPDKTRINPFYLAKQLRTTEAIRYFGQRANGSTRYGLSSSAIANLEISLAPLPQQRRIAEVLGTVDGGIEQTEALIAKQQQVKAGLMHDLFTRGVTSAGQLRPLSIEAPDLYKESPVGGIPKEWDYALLDDVAHRASGHTPNRNHPEYWDGGIKWVSLADSWRLDRVYISETDKEISALGIANSSAVLHPPGIVVLSRDAGIGKSAITTCEMAVSQHFMCWRCGPKLDTHYLYYWLQFRKREFENIATGTTIPTIGLRFFKNYRIPVSTDVNEQKKIGAMLLSADQIVQAEATQLAKLRQLKQGLMQDLLTGRVPVSA